MVIKLKGRLRTLKDAYGSLMKLRRALDDIERLRIF
jgi:hypothetical protein